MLPRQRVFAVTAVAAILVAASVVGWSLTQRDDPPAAPSVFAGHTIDTSASTPTSAPDVVEPIGQAAVGTASVSGTVVDQEGPVAGLDVALERRDERGHRTRLAATSTTSHGHFSFTVSPAAGDEYALVIPTPPPGQRFTETATFTLAKDRRTHRTISLTPTSLIAGTLVDHDGEPVADTEVVLDGAVTMRVSTDANGRFAFADPAAGQWQLRAPGASQTVAIEAGERLTGVTLRQREPEAEARVGSISGTVTAAGGERGEVTIRVFDVGDGPGAEPVATTRLSADRTAYRLSDLPAGSYKVVASAEGWIDTWFGDGSPAHWGEAEIITVDAGQTAGSISIMLRPSGALAEPADPLIGDPSAGEDSSGD